MDTEVTLSVPVVVGLALGSVVLASVLFSVVVGVTRIRRALETPAQKAVRAHFLAAHAGLRITGFAPLPSAKNERPRLRVSCVPLAGGAPSTIDVEVGKNDKVREL